MNSVGGALIEYFKETGWAAFEWRQIVMILVSFLLLYLAIKKGFEPLLLVPIAFGMLLANIPLGGVMTEPIYESLQVTGADGSSALVPILNESGNIAKAR